MFFFLSASRRAWTPTILNSARASASLAITALDPSPLSHPRPPSHPAPTPGPLIIITAPGIHSQQLCCLLLHHTCLGNPWLQVTSAPCWRDQSNDAELGALSRVTLGTTHYEPALGEGSQRLSQDLLRVTCQGVGTVSPL